MGGASALARLSCQRQRAGFENRADGSNCASDGGLWQLTIRRPGIGF